MPSTGFYLFEQSYLTNFTEVSVSMPSTGFYLFLPLDGWKMLKTINMCQCPQRASTYFFRFPKKMKHGLRNVSMPSTGFYLFLQLWRHIVQLSQEYCVNALNGLLLISSLEIDEDYQRVYCMCQCPQRASTYFFSTYFCPQPM